MKPNSLMFPKLVVDPQAPKDSMYFIDIKYKRVQVGKSEPARFKEVIDWEATGRASAVICNIQGE